MGKLTQLEEVRRERKRKRLVKRITGLAVGLALLVGVAFFGSRLRIWIWPPRWRI